MATTKLVRDGFTIPMPKPGDGTKIMCRPDGSLYCSWDRPRPKMALDAAPVGGPAGSPDYNSYNSHSRAGDDDPNGDPNDVNPGGDDLEDKVRALLEGKLSPEDLDALCDLLDPDDNAAPMPAQDRRARRQAHDGARKLAMDALIRQRIAESGVARAERVLKQNAKLMERFPALRGARVV